MSLGRIYCLCPFLVLVIMSAADQIGDFKRAWATFLEDPHFDYASISMTILDSRNGSILFEHDKDKGLPPASSMKTITAAAAIHYLGANYTYSTTLQYSGKLDSQTGFLDGFIYLVGSGDPSLGSDRFDDSTKADTIMQKWFNAIRQAGIKKCRGIIGDPTAWRTTKTVLIDGWTWNDLGQYYGTGHSALNWRENEFNIYVQPGCNVDDPGLISNIPNPPPKLEIISELKTVATDGDLSLYFSIDGSNQGVLRGTVALTASPNFYVRCAVPDSALYIADELTRVLRSNGIEVEEEAKKGASPTENITVLDTHQSPPLSKLLEPFLRISINMYGEVFVKTIALQTGLSSFYDAPLKVLPTYVKELIGGPDPLAGVATTDGSGLSRSNRLTTYVLARILHTVQRQPWFDATFFNAFPTINGLRMKSGTLNNTIAYAGYIRENHFVFSFMINNYYGKTAQQMREKIWSVLDSLK